MDGIPVEHFPLAKKIFADKYAQVIAPDTATCDDIGVNHLHKLLILADWRDFLRQGAQERLRQDDILLPEKPTSFEPPALTTRFLVRRKFPLSCLVWGSKVPHPDVRPVSLSYANDLRHHLRNHRTDETPDTVGWTVTGVVFYNKPDGTWEDVEKLVNNGKIKISIYDGAQRCAAAEMMGWEELDVCLYLNPTAEEQKFCVVELRNDDQAVDDTVDLPDSVPITNPDHRFHFTPVPTTQQSKPLASAKLLFIKHYPTLLSNLEPAMPGICDDHQALTKDQSEAIGWLLKIACYPRALQSKFDQLWDLVERRAKPAVDNLARRENKLGSLFCVLLTPRKLHDLRQLRKDDPWPMVDFALIGFWMEPEHHSGLQARCSEKAVGKLRKVPWPTTKRALPEPEEKRPSTVKLSRGATRSTRTAYSRAAASKQPPVILPVTTSTTSSSGDMRHSTPLPASSGKRCRTLDEHFGADVSAIKSTEDDGEHEHNGDHNQEEAHHPSTGDEEPSAKRRKTIKSLSGDGGSSDSVVVSAEQSPTASAGQEPGTATPSPSSTSLDAVEEEQSPTHSIPPNDEMEVASTSQSLPNSVKPDAEAQSLQDSGRGSGSEPNPPHFGFSLAVNAKNDAEDATEQPSGPKKQAVETVDPHPQSTDRNAAHRQLLAEKPQTLQQIGNELKKLDLYKHRQKLLDVSSSFDALEPVKADLKSYSSIYECGASGYLVVDDGAAGLIAETPLGPVVQNSGSMEALVDVRDLLPVVPAVVIDVEPKEGPEMVLEENIIPIDDCDSLSSPSKSGNEILSEVKKPSFTIEVDINQHLLSKLCTLYPDEVLLPLLAGTASADHRRGAFNHLMSALVDQEKYAASCKLQLTSPLLSPSSLTRDVIVDVLELVDRCCVDATLLAAEQFHLAVLNVRITTKPCVCVCVFVCVSHVYIKVAIWKYRGTTTTKDFSQAASRQILVENVDSRHVGCKWHYEMLQSVEFCEEYTAYNVPGDGNCFFRAISLAKTGSDEHYLAMRLAAVFGMLHYGQAFEQLYENSHPKSKPRTFPNSLKSPASLRKSLPRPQ
ncbi:uncharacterized protein LOC129584230 [Paramacrobiotus metropolitanus]|uniref:uncharacterized protein LOC129584230 n=1 Tax=Paramacrobiotus metropolitanus TaxID=2943436 RepID=UPI0024462674|nr:uncharacterized protein LOC129584230 [Paramacrobiotus metropolitanus]